jgi:hypothetical protein
MTDTGPTGPNDADDQARHPQQPAEGDRDEVEGALHSQEDEGASRRPASEESASDADAGEI